jgi:glucose dehydrogenase
MSNGNEEGVLFIGATPDGRLPAYDSRTGKLLWQTRLPAPAEATPGQHGQAVRSRARRRFHRGVPSALI